VAENGVKLKLTPRIPKGVPTPAGDLIRNQMLSGALGEVARKTRAASYPRRPLKFPKV